MPAIRVLVGFMYVWYVLEAHDEITESTPPDDITRPYECPPFVYST